MKIAIIAAGLALAGGLGAAPAEAQYYHGHHGYHGGYGYRGGGYRGGYGHRGYGPRYGYGYGHRGRLVCTYRHGFRRCFHA